MWNLFETLIKLNVHKPINHLLLCFLRGTCWIEQRLHLLLCSLCDTFWSEFILLTCVVNRYWDLPSSGPARRAQDARRVLHDEPSRSEVLGYRAQGRHCNPFVRCGAPHRTSGVQKGGAMGS